MKHIKLFENWAEEIEIPVYLNPEIKYSLGTDGETMTYNVFHENIKKELQFSSCKLNPDNGSYVNFQHFYEIKDFLNTNGYYSLIINQRFCKFQLQDFEEVPEVKSTFNVSNTQIKSLKGLENKRYSSDIMVAFSRLENLKYCPTSHFYNFSYNPLLSYYGIKSINIFSYNDNLCGLSSYNEGVITEKQLNDIEFHANQFCNFKNRLHNSFTNKLAIHPWYQCYYDPNDVENFEFLFNPFWQNSEKFRETAKVYINDIDLVKLSKEELW